MSIPNPPLDLTGHCSAVYNNTLYIYSPAGFQSLPLQQNATWTILSPGVSVEGGVCVKAVPSSDPAQAALFIVGGAANSSSSWYSGLQKYLFSNGTWETVNPQVMVTQNRQNHGAAYLNATDDILVYAGTQNGQGASDAISSQTFLISASPPYTVLSFESEAPPLTAPMVIPWDDSRAVVIGGSPYNQEIWTFGLDQGWANLGTTLSQGIQNQSSTQCAIVSGDDGSKVMDMFDLATIPNNVTNYVLLTASGQPGATGQTVGGQPSKKRRKRDLTLANWPAYNGTLAPTVTRSDYRIAHAPDGIIVITGGNTAMPIAMFDSNQNSWLDASSIIGGNQLPSVSVAPTSTSTASSAAPVGGSDITRSKSLTVLGGILGAIFAMGALLIIVLVLMKWNKERKKRERQSYLNEKNDDRLSFADQGAEFMHEAGGSVGRRYSQSLNSPKAGLQMFHNKNKGHRRGLASDEAALVKNRSPLGMSEPMEMSRMVDNSRASPPGSRKQESTPKIPVHAESPRAGDGSQSAPSPSADPERSRSNGWSTYFANNEVTNLASMQSPNRDAANTVDPSVKTTDFYNDSNSKLKAAPLKPLELNLGAQFDSPRLSMSRVATGSPSYTSSSAEFTKGQAAVIGRYSEQSTMASTPITTTSAFALSTPDKSRAESTSDTRSIGSQYSINTNPYFSGGVNPYHTNDPTANLFSGKSGKSANSPTLRPKSILTDTDSRASTVTVFPGANGLPSPKFAPSKPAATDPPIPKALVAGVAGNPQVRDSGASNVTVFPHGFSSPRASTFGPGAVKPRIVDATSPTSSMYFAPPQPAAKVAGKMYPAEDMSWLNINTEQ